MNRDIIPSSNIEFQDIRDTLNSNGGTVTNDVISVFKSDAKINMWSKYKPIDLNVDFCQDVNPDKPNYKLNWWRGNDGFCGLDIPSSDDYTSLDKPIIYILPKGDKSSPYRIGDFANYFSKAEKPYSVSIGDSNIIIGAIRTVTISKVNVSDLNLTLEEAFKTETPYLGICVKHSSGTYYKNVRADSNELYKIDIGSVPNLSVGEVNVYAFLSNYSIPDWTNVITSSIFSLNEYNTLQAVKPSEDIWDISFTVPLEEKGKIGTTGETTATASAVSRPYRVNKRLSGYILLRTVVGTAYKMPDKTVIREKTVSPAAYGASPMDLDSTILPPYNFTMKVNKFIESADDVNLINRNNGEYLLYEYVFNYE